MNCFSGFEARRSVLTRARCWLLLFATVVSAACGVEPSESADGPVLREYDVHFGVRPNPSEATVEVTMRLRQPRDLVREITFPSLPGSMSKFQGDGELRMEGNSLHWLPPAGGGSLNWLVKVEHEREPGEYDAWIGADWAIFRAEDIIPRARTRALKHSVSDTTLAFDLPGGWSAITEYPATSDPIRVRRPDRRFDQPSGWIVLGDLGVRRERIVGIRIAVAAPQGQRVRRMDMLALLNLTLPDLVALLPNPPTRLTIVSAGDPMWRGGLSAPASLFIHADRPLISENATSALLHEVLHTTLSLRSAPGMDWILEGLAEYYSLELLHRGGAITSRRHRAALADLAEWSEDSPTLCGASSTGATTARAVMIFSQLDQELRNVSAGEVSLDDVLRALLERDAAVDAQVLAELAEDLTGQPSDTLHSDNLPGCHKMNPGNPGG